MPVILYLHPSNEMYGADRSLVALVRATSGLGCPIVILPNDLPYAGQLEAVLREDGVDVRVGPLPVMRRGYLRPRRVLPWMIRTLWGTVWLVRLTRKVRARVLVSNTTAVVGGPLVAMFTRTPHIWYVREVITKPRWFRGAIRLLAARSRGVVVAVSHAVADWVGPLDGHGPVVGYNGVDIVGDPRGLADRPSAVFVGRLNSWKGQDVFVEAADLVHAHLPDATFRIVGDAVPGDAVTGPAFARHVKKVDPSSTWLTWEGEVTSGREAMRDAWLVAVPSTEPDPMPNVVLEAMAEGRAVVGSRLGGIPEMIEDGTSGTLVAPGDVTELAAAMTGLLGNRERAAAIGRAGRDSASVQFSRTASRERWRAILTDQLSAKRG